MKYETKRIFFGVGGGGGAAVGGFGLVFKFSGQYLNGAPFLGLARTFTL